jgi:short-subunit dehydrogenase
MVELKGKTALITGASSGIGKAMAHQLASEGVHLVLVARSRAALAELADELGHHYNVRASAVALDLSQPHCGVELHSQLQSQGVAVDILVNNAGFGTYGRFETLSPELEQHEIAVNVAAVVSLTHAFIPGMLQRGTGVVLNLASTAAFQPVPYMAVYAATKAFVLSFSEALWAECADKGVHVMALCPGPVETPFIDKLGDASVRQTSVFSKTIQPAQVAEQALMAIQGRAPSRIVGIKNWLLANSLRLAPRSVVAHSGEKMLRPAVQC